MKEPEKPAICDENVFSAFFRETSKTLRNYIYFRFGNADIADDITQEAFIKLWQNCKDVRHPKSFLYTVANNVALNHTANRKVVLKYAASNQESNIDHENPQFLLEEQEFKLKFENALSNLTEAQRVALLLNRIEGKKYREIADMLDISVKAVEKRIHGALVSMREQIDNFK